jgi:hypothetical protein
MLMPGLALIVWVLVFAAGLVGLAVGARLPDRHRTDESRGVVSVSMAMVGTLTALVLGLLLSNASVSFRSQSQLLMSISANLMRTDVILRAYGPEANDARAVLRQYAAATLHDIFPPNGGPPQTENEVTLELFGEAERKLANLSPATNVQRWTLEEVKVLVIDGIGEARWKLVVQGENTVPTAVLVLLVFWLVLLFASYGLFAPRHATTMVVLLLSSAATAGAIALIIDLERPIGGFVRLSAEPMEHAVAEMSR